MVEVFDGGAYLLDENTLVDERAAKPEQTEKRQQLAKNTMAYGILQGHNTSGDEKNLKIKFDAMASHDITFVGIIQTAIASGLKEFPLPYVLTNCHNSLCAVGGTINEDDHVFGYSAAKKYGGQFVPPHQAVIHQYMREMQAGAGKMILGSDSHTRYGALGTMAIGEGGGELVKQLLKQTYDIKYPGVVAVYLKNAPRPGVGPQDVALAIIGKVFASGYVKNKVMEFVGPGIASLSMDFRNGVDVMTTETTCLSSIWRTDEKTEKFLSLHGRRADYKKLEPKYPAYYDGAISVDLAKIKPMIAMPFHPSHIYTIEEVNNNLLDILHEVEEDAKVILANKKLNLGLKDKIIGGKFRADQGVIAGCAGGLYENLMNTAHVLRGNSTGDFPLSVYPASQPVFVDLLQKGAISDLAKAGATIRTAFCGPCFGAGDVPENQGFSIRHTTRNFPNREGSKPNQGQIACVALMDARSIAATARNQGFLTAADESWEEMPPYEFDKTVYEHRVYNGIGKPQPKEELVQGPNIKPWPKMRQLTDNLLLQMCAVITDPVTTTDELIPSGETSSYRSNPLGLAEFTLSRKVPEYVERAKKVQKQEVKRVNGEEIEQYLPEKLRGQGMEKNTGIGSVIFAVKPGDGSAREQAASCQRVLGADANIALEYATKRYRSNLINWGIIPFIVEKETMETFSVGDKIFIAGIKKALAEGAKSVQATVYKDDGKEKEITLLLKDLAKEERDILLAGCLINFNNLK